MNTINRIFPVIVLCLMSILLIGQVIDDEPDFFKRLGDKSLILHAEGMSRGSEQINSYISNFYEAEGDVKVYKKEFDIAVSPILSYEIGMIQTQNSTYSVMFLKRKDRPNKDIEFLVIHKQSETKNSPSTIDDARNLWMKLCNQHKAAELVKRVYTEDAYHYNRGRLLQGTKDITQEYGYMNNERYSLQLTPKKVTLVDPDTAYEIGQCSGSYNKPYMLLWKRQEDGSWQVLMDSND